jgi:hypothetical protein
MVLASDSFLKETNNYIYIKIQCGGTGLCLSKIKGSLKNENNIA